MNNVVPLFPVDKVGVSYEEPFEELQPAIGFRNGFFLSMLFWAPVLYLIFG